jgi:hypothetical protein
MRPYRPSSVLVLAVFHFILGGLGILQSFVAIGVTLLASTMNKAPAAAAGPLAGGQAPISAAAQYQYLDAHLPYWKEADIGFGVLYLVISVLMIAAGAGLVLMKPWGRLLSLVYGVSSILTQTVRMIYLFAIFLPVMLAFYDTMLRSGAGGGPPPGVVAGMKFGVVIGMCVAFLGYIYPILVLILLLRPSVAAAFRGEPTGREDFGDRYDRGGRDDDYGRPPTGYEQEPPPGYGGEPDDRIGPAPR